MTKDQVITIRLINNGWVASYHTGAPYTSGEFFDKTPEGALKQALESLGEPTYGMIDG